jgi:hypothetical protein
MKITVTQPLRNIRGETIKRGAEDDAPALLRDVLIEALLARQPDEQKPPSAAEQLKLHRLASRVQTEDVIDFDVAEIKLCQDRVAAIYWPAMAGPALVLLEGGAP